jgi:putative hydrolase of the HAD superfamily
MRWDVARALDSAHGLPRASVFDTLYRTETWRDIERGIGDTAAWSAAAHRELERRAGRSLPALHEEWRQAQAPISANLDLARGLRGRYKLSVLSNADASLRERLRRDDLLSLFDDVVISAEVGVAKPDAAVFRMAAERLGLAPAECVFVDDWDKNVEAAREAGMQALLFRIDKGDDLRAQLGSLGITATA